MRYEPPAPSTTPASARSVLKWTYRAGFLVGFFGGLPLNLPPGLALMLAYGPESEEADGGFAPSATIGLILGHVFAIPGYLGLLIVWPIESLLENDETEPGDAPEPGAGQPKHEASPAED